MEPGTEIKPPEICNFKLFPWQFIGNFKVVDLLPVGTGAWHLAISRAISIVK